MKMTLPQQDIYYEQLLYPEEPIYNIGAKVVVNGFIDYTILSKAFEKLVREHDAYQSVLKHDRDEPIIKFDKERKPTLHYIDFSSEESPEISAESYMKETFLQPFKLKDGNVLYKFVLLKISEKLFYIFSMYHHIITDGWGTSLMFQRWVKFYNELANEGKMTSEYPYTYSDFVINDAGYAKSVDYKDDKEYWTTRFASLPEQLFPKINKQVDVNHSNRKEIIIKRDVYNRLNDVAKKSKGSTFHVLLALFFLYFGRKQRSNDLAIGIPVLNRSKSIFKKTVGLFMGVSALRMKIDYDATFEEFVFQIRQQLRLDYRHQRFPLGKLIKELDVFKEKGRLFNISMSYEKQNYADHFEGTKTTVIPMTHGAERLALALYIREFDELEDVKIDFDYNVNYFSEETITSVGEHFQNLIATIANNSSQKLGEIQYLTKSELHFLRRQRPVTLDVPKNETFLPLFEKICNETPNHIAAFDALYTYSYKELDEKSNRVAQYLLENKKVNSQAAIAVLMNRTSNLVVVYLGILKAGCVFIPIDPKFPKKRIQYILNHSNVQHVFCDDEIGVNLTPGLKSIKVQAAIDYCNDAPVKIDVLGVHSAYVIYTSGSTGNPKGVEITHGALLNFLQSMAVKPGIEADDTIFSVTTQSFDISLLEFFTPLIVGASAYIVPKDILQDPLKIVRTLNNIKPTILQATPSFYQILYNSGWDGDTSMKLLCGGDSLSESLCGKLLANSDEVWNMYGPTETTIWSSCKRIMKSKDASNIGQPIANTQFYILDDSIQLLPPNSPGNLFISGVGLAKGYYNDIELTKSNFVTNPLNKDERIYRTGDCGYWTNNGEVIFTGRTDFQVKIRGYRIELEEIETNLNTMKAVNASAVIAKKQEDGTSFLVAYVILNQRKYDASKLLSKLKTLLPHYMIPTSIIALDQFPLTPNNKIDRKSLERRVDYRQSTKQDNRQKTEIERMIAAYFQQILDLDKEVSLSDNFFALGGHSLNAVKLLKKIEDNLLVVLALKVIFDHPTVASLSKYISRLEPKQHKPIVTINTASHYAITDSQMEMWVASQKMIRSKAYNLVAAYAIDGKLNLDLLLQSFEILIEKYEILRTNFTLVDGIPRQKIGQIEHGVFNIVELDAFNKSVQEIVEEFAYKEFNLENDLLLRVGFFKDENARNNLIFSTHHIIMDGWSLQVLINELTSNYHSLTTQKKPNFKPLSIQFKDYAAWQIDRANKLKAQNTSFWNQYMSGYTWEPLVPQDASNYEAKLVTMRQRIGDSSILTKLTSMSKKLDVTHHSFLATSLSVLISKMYGLNDICFGTLNLGRTQSNLQDQIGMFVKTLPFRLHVDLDQSFNKILQYSHNTLLEIAHYQDIPLAKRSDFKLDLLFTVENEFFNRDLVPLTLNIVLRSIETTSLFSLFSIFFKCVVTDSELFCEIEFDSNKYDEETITLLLLKFEILLDNVLKNPNSSLASIDTDLDFEKNKNVTFDIKF